MTWRGEDDAENVIAILRHRMGTVARVMRGFQLRLGLKDRRREDFDDLQT